MDSDTASAELNAVEHNVISLGSDRAGIGVDQVPVLVHRHREGMVHGDESLLFIAPLKKRELHDPEEIELVVVDQAQLLAEFESERAENVPHDLVLVCRDQEQVALLAVHFADDRLDLFLFHELGKGALDASVFLELDIRKSLGAISLGKGHKRVDLLAGHAALSLDIDAADGSVLHGCSVGEHCEIAALYFLGDVDERHAETGIRFVGSVVVHGVDPFHSGKRELYVEVKGLLGHILDQSLIDIDDIVDVYE